MSVWLCIPSARAKEEANPILEKWSAAGYSIALWRDTPADPPIYDLLLTGEYPGYARAVNALVKEVLTDQPDCDWCVTGGDDTEPDPNHTAEEIAYQCADYFESRYDHKPYAIRRAAGKVQNFGVMQPTGDRFAEGSIDRIAGSPWIGREFCIRMYGGKGPLYEGYSHMFEDEELFNVAKMLGVYWPRPDLIHLHHQFMRKDTSVNSPAVSKPAPPHLVRWNTPEHWNASKALFVSRRAAGFPGHEPLAVNVGASR